MSRAIAGAGGATGGGLGGYLRQSEQPLSSLVFLLPVLIYYEVGAWCYSWQAGLHGGQRTLLAFNLLHDFFRIFGARAMLLPALTVVAILLVWHIAGRDAWRVSGLVLSGMLLESIVLAAPLLLLTDTHPGGPVYWHDFVGLAGAGIYEELLFRLAALTLLSMLLIDFGKLPKRWGYPLMVFCAALMFAGYHYLGIEHFQWRTFAFRAMAGVYLGMVFIGRGFGITAGTHVCYNTIIGLRLLMAPAGG